MFEESLFYDLLLTDNRYMYMIDKSAQAALITAVVCELLRQVFVQFQGIAEPGCWSWVLAITACGRRFLSNSSKRKAALNPPDILISKQVLLPLGMHYKQKVLISGCLNHDFHDQVFACIRSERAFWFCSMHT